MTNPCIGKSLLDTSTGKAASEIGGAVSDLNRNYWTMKKSKTVGSDDYFHCKGNYDPAKRGPVGEATASGLGYAKELFDYPKNRTYRDMSHAKAKEDFYKDLSINKEGRNRAHDNRYSSSQDACASFRPDKLDKEYW